MDLPWKSGAISFFVSLTKYKEYFLSVNLLYFNKDFLDQNALVISDIVAKRSDIFF